MKERGYWFTIFIAKHEYENLQKEILKDISYACELNHTPELKNSEWRTFPRDCYLKVRVHVHIIGREHEDIRRLIHVHEGQIIKEEGDDGDKWKWLKTLGLQWLMVYPGTVGGFVLQDWDNVVDVINLGSASTYYADVLLIFAISIIPVITSWATENIITLLKKR